MNAKELFEKLENTGNIYSYYEETEDEYGRKIVIFSTGGWSENEELVRELEKELIWKILLVKWERGGHYTFEIPQDMERKYIKK